MLRGIGLRFNLHHDVLVRMSDKRGSEKRELLVGLRATEPLCHSMLPATIQRSAIAALRHRFTLLQAASVCRAHGNAPHSVRPRGSGDPAFAIRRTGFPLTRE